jgi:hypothetical protein
MTEAQRQAVRARFGRDVSTLTNALLFGIRPGAEDAALALDFINGLIKAAGQSDEITLQFYELSYDIPFATRETN